MNVIADRRSPILPWVALVTVWVVWGSTYLGIRYAVHTIPPLLMAGTRYFIAGAVMLAVMRRHLRGVRRPTGRQIRSSVIVGAALLLGGNGLLSVGEQHLDSGFAALLVTTVPLMMIVLAAAKARSRVPARSLVAVALGTAGVLFLVGMPGTKIDAGAVAIVLIGALSWAGGSIYSKGAEQPAHPLVATALQMTAGGLLLMVAGLAKGELGDFHPADVSTSSLIGMAWLIVAGSLIAFSAYTYALKTLPTDTVATYAYVNPIVAVVLGAAIAHEPMTAGVYVGGLAIVAAVVVTLTKRKPAVTVQPADEVEPARAVEGASDETAGRPEAGKAKAEAAHCSA